MKINKLFMTLLLTLVAIPLCAQDIQRGMIVEMKSGEKVSFTFEDNPKLTFNGVDFLINTHMYQFSYAANDIQRYTFGDVDAQSGIDAIMVNGQSITNDNITINTNKPLAKIMVYGVDGRMVGSAIADSQGIANFSLKNLPIGIYIVKYNEKSLKITKQ